MILKIAVGAVFWQSENMSKSCPFCNISKEETILKEGKNFYVILSNPRLMPGHLLVITKRHIQKLAEFTQQERQELFDIIVEFEEKILSKLTSGCDIRQHYHPFLESDGIAVNHFHFHVQPREFEDEFWKRSQRFEKSVFKKVVKEEKERITKLLGH